jgi:hypothetical protein
MFSDQDRYTRQRRLAEVGDAGQARIEEALLIVRGDEAAMVELAYLHRAGVRHVTILPRAAPSSFQHASAFHFAASQRVAAGAWRALCQLRSVLRIGDECS